MAMDFSTAPQEQGGSLIPENTLAWATVNVRPKASDMGVITFKGKDNPDNRYLDLEIELTSGPATGRKVFHKLGVAGSEKWVTMSMAAIRHVLEVGKRAGPDNPGGYMLGVNLPDGDDRMWMELDGLQCAIEVGVEPAKGDFKAKNSIKAFLSPHPDSPTNKKFQALVAGETSSGPAAAEKPKATGGNAWQQRAGVTASTPASAGQPPVRPTWTGGAPPVATGTAPAADTTKAPW